MIGSLRGTVIDRSIKGEVVVEVGGVGYRVTVPTSAVAAFVNGADTFLFVHTHVREDALMLFGFPTRDERNCFEVLLGTHGVGTSLALAILSAHSPNSLVEAIATDDVDALTTVPGVGKKTAARLLIELKSRLAALDLDAGSVNVGAEGTTASMRSPSKADAADPRNDVRAALTSLGYGPDEIRATLRELPPVGDAASLLKQALAALGQKR